MVGWLLEEPGTWNLERLLDLTTRSKVVLVVLGGRSRCYPVSQNQLRKLTSASWEEV